MSLEYKVPRILWENLESVLYAQSKRYVMELAKRLGVAEKELLKRVLPTSDSLHVMIQDSQAESNQCKAYVQHDKMTVFCKKATAYHSEFCVYHRNTRMTVIDGTEPIVIQKVKDRNDMEPMWVQDNVLLNSNGHVVGKINRDQSIMKRFVVEVPKTESSLSR
jgi:uncharacterized protein YegJ (DUF2314 family)